MNLELFDSPSPESRIEALGAAAFVFRAMAIPDAHGLLQVVQAIAAEAPWRHMQTPGGRRMSVATTNCGQLGWTSDARGYRYVPQDPLTGRCWPPLPDLLRRVAADAAARAGFRTFAPDACLINRYEPGTRLSLHQDRDERDLSAPIVSISLGLPAVFLFGGLQRTDRSLRVPLGHGDVVVWGGADRLRFHGVLPLRDGSHPVLGAHRINLTLRCAG